MDRAPYRGAPSRSGKNHRDATQTGYQIAKSHGLSKGEKAAEGEFLAGWIALRYLNDPATGLKHFKRLGEIAESGTEKARAGYWAGRALEAMGQPGKAKAFYREASRHTTVYYGQLAREKIGLGAVPEVIPSGIASDAARAVVNNDEVVRAFRIVAELGHKNELPMFMESFASRFKSVDEMNAVAGVVWAEGGDYMALRLAKASAAKNIDIDCVELSRARTARVEEDRQAGRSTTRLCAGPPGKRVPSALPAAKWVHRVSCRSCPAQLSWSPNSMGSTYQDGILTSDPAFNVMLGAGHLGDLVSNHRGSYVLALVSYNAGPRRSREWIAEYGDLRTGEIDPVDWVESIPFPETRQYVQKVLQNLHIYRSRLAFKTVQPMTADLARGSTVETISVSASEPARSLSVRTIQTSIFGPVHKQAEIRAEPIFGGPIPSDRSSAH